MRIWRLVAGIISIVLSVFIGIQSMAAGLADFLEGNGGTSGAVGLICGILILIGGIVSLACQKIKRVGAGIALVIIFFMAGVIGIIGHGQYKDLIIWSVWALINAFIALISCFIKKNSREGAAVICKNEKATYEASEFASSAEGINVFPVVIAMNANEGNTDFSSLEALFLKRAYLFLEDEEWERADGYCEKVLDMNPENANAYVGKLLAEMRVSHINNLCESDLFTADNRCFKKALRFADEELRNSLSQIEKDNLEQKKRSDEELYTLTVEKMNNAKKTKDYIALAETFESISEVHDSLELQQKCQKVIKKRRTVKKAIICGLVSIVFVVVIGASVELSIAIPKYKETKAKRLIDENKYYDAYLLLEDIGKTELIGEDKTELAFRLLGTENHALSVKLLNELHKNVKIGDIIEFGRIELPEGSGNVKPIKWRVIKKNETSVMLVCEEILMNREYSVKDRRERQELYNWDNSSIREELNTVFLKKAFTEGEITLIEDTTVKADFNDESPFLGQGADTVDKVFLLSSTEAEASFAVDADRVVDSTEWWLRTKGTYHDKVTVVGEHGKIDYTGRLPKSQLGVRPALWLKLK